MLRDEITNTNEKKTKYVKITYLTERERNVIRMDDVGSKLTLNHPSLMDQEEEKLDG